MRQEEHVKPFENPFGYLQEQMSATLGLDAQGNPNLFFDDLQLTSPNAYYYSVRAADDKANRSVASLQAGVKHRDIERRNVVRGIDVRTRSINLFQPDHIHRRQARSQNESRPSARQVVLYTAILVKKR